MTPIQVHWVYSPAKTDRIDWAASAATVVLRSE